MSLFDNLSFQREGRSQKGKELVRKGGHPGKKTGNRQDTRDGKEKRKF